MNRDNQTLDSFWYVCRQFNLNYFEMLMLELLLQNNNFAISQEEFYEYALEYENEINAKPLSFIFVLNQGQVYINAIVFDYIFERLPSFSDGINIYFTQNEKLCHSHELLDELSCFLSNYRQTQNPIMVALKGARGSGRMFLLKTLCAQKDIPLVTVDFQKTVNIDDLAIISILFEALICVKNYKGEPQVNVLKNYVSVVFATTEEDIQECDDFVLITREIKSLTTNESFSLWAVQLSGMKLEDSIDLKKIAGLYQLNAGQIVSAANKLKAEQLLVENNEISNELFHKILKTQNSLSKLISVTPIYSNKNFDDLILPQAQKQQLVDICGFARSTDTVFSQWKFSQKITYGRGLTMLFYGASGTGKTMAATVMANELGLQLFRVDLSQIISKYVGETQKNIANIFDTAKKSNCILLFDEADALFARRSDGGDSQDKYSNAEIAFLLQKTEDYDGICILCTNLLNVFDEAFRRRISFMVNFPFPDKSLRKHLWEGIFPKAAPLQDIDYDFISQFELSGACIKNCALHSALIAASEEKEISMKHIIFAVKYEYQKQGKSIPNHLVEQYIF